MLSSGSDRLARRALHRAHDALVRAAAAQVDGQAVRSCLLPVSSVGTKKVTTLEGLGSTAKPSALQQAFIDEQAAQCGYCVNAW